MPLSVTTLNRARRRLIDMHFRAKAGHIGGNLSCLDAMMLIYHEYLGLEDRFILSKGHSAGALYVTLWSLGRLTDSDLDRFHQDDTLLGGIRRRKESRRFVSRPAALGTACRWRPVWLSRQNCRGSIGASSA